MTQVHGVSPDMDRIKVDDGPVDRYGHGPEHGEKPPHSFSEKSRDSDQEKRYIAHSIAKGKTFGEGNACFGNFLFRLLQPQRDSQVMVNQRQGLTGKEHDIQKYPYSDQEPESERSLQD